MPKRKKEKEKIRKKGLKENNWELAKSTIAEF